MPPDNQQGAQGLDFMFAHSDAHFPAAPGLSEQAPELHALQTNLPPPFAPLRPRPVGDPTFDWSNQYSHPGHDSSLYNPLFADPDLGDTLSPFDPDLASQGIPGMLPYQSALLQTRNPFDLSYSTSSSAPTMPEPIDTSLGSELVGTRSHSLTSATSPGPSVGPFASSRQPDYYRTSQLLSPQSATSPDAPAFYTNAMPGTTLAYDTLDEHSLTTTSGLDRRQSSVSTTSMSAQRGFTMLSRAYNDGVYG